PPPEPPANAGDAPAPPANAGDTPAPPGDPPRRNPGEARRDLLLPTRMYNWARKHGVTSLAQLAAIRPGHLVGQPNIGRRTLRQTRNVIERTLGVRWEDPAGSDAKPPEETASGAGAARRSGSVLPSWRDLPEPPEALDDVSLNLVPLPTRMAN